MGSLEGKLLEFNQWPWGEEPCLGRANIRRHIVPGRGEPVHGVEMLGDRLAGPQHFHEELGQRT